MAKGSVKQYLISQEILITVLQCEVNHKIALNIYRLTRIYDAYYAYGHMYL